MVPALVAKKAAAEEERFSDEESIGEEEEKPASQPVTKPAKAEEERNSDDSNSGDPKDVKPASAANPAKKEEPPDDDSPDGSNDVKKHTAKKAKKPALGDPTDEEDAVKANDEAVKYKLDQAKIQMDYQAKPYEHVEKYGPVLVAVQAEEVEVDVAPHEEEKEGVDANVDATRLEKIREVSNDEENHPVQEKQPKTDEFFENDDQSNEIDVQTNDEEQSNDRLSNEKDEVNGNDNDQVKTEELFESIAILLFSPFYKFRKKRWEPGKLDQWNFMKI